MTVYHTETKNKLSDALWKLMKTDSYEDITITQICQEAKVGRRTFYRHFPSKRKVIEYGFRLKGEAFAAISARCNTMAEMIGRSFQFFRKERKFIQLVIQNNLSAELYGFVKGGEMFDIVLDVYIRRANIPAPLREYVANVIAAMHTSLLITWADHNFEEDWREISQFESKLFSEMM